MKFRNQSIDENSESASINGRNKHRFVDMLNVEIDEIITWADTKNTTEKTLKVDCPTFWRFSRSKTVSSLITVIELKRC